MGEQPTRPVVLVVQLAVHQRCHLLEVLLGLVQSSFEHPGLLKLVGSPLALVGKHEDAERIGYACCDGGEETANCLGLPATAIDTALPAGATGIAAHSFRSPLSWSDTSRPVPASVWVVVVLAFVSGRAGSVGCTVVL